ncbi:hypothetical protein DFQ26_008840, partial [Actinomortierella ambigua]
MGVPGSFRALRDKGVALEKHDHLPTLPVSAEFRVDVSQLFHSTCRYAYGRLHSDVTFAHKQLEKQLLRLGDKSNLVLYVDGHPPLEKSTTHVKREASRQHQRLQTQQQLTYLQDRLTNNQRVRKHHLRTLNKHLRGAFKWELGDRTSFVQYLIDNGYNAVLCDTETDTQLARDCRPDDVVVSGDSDFFILQVRSHSLAAGRQGTMSKIPR